MDPNYERKKPSMLLDSMVTLDAVVFTEVLNGRDSAADVDLKDALTVVGAADELIRLCLCRDISRQVFFTRLSRLAAGSRGRNPLGEWLQGLPAVETALVFMAAAYAANAEGGFEMDTFLENCQLPLGDRGRFLRRIKEGRLQAKKRGLVQFKKNRRSGTLLFRLAPEMVETLYPKLRSRVPEEVEEEDSKVAGLKPCPGNAADCSCRRPWPGSSPASSAPALRPASTASPPASKAPGCRRG